MRFFKSTFKKSWLENYLVKAWLKSLKITKSWFYSIKTWCIFCEGSAKMTKSSVQSISHGHPTQNLRENTSSTMMNSTGRNADPLCTLTLTSYCSLKELFTCVLLLAPTYMDCTTLTIHFGTPTTQRAHHSTFQGTL